ncbi:MAG: hypothetical protein JNK69_06720 [Saprospiraceae bacterium]|nr:hypothetical protein [Candidatus Vicinibacter proximus]MBL7823083.1 hypothetical protein [Saprospiraceae bacterium]
MKLLFLMILFSVLSCQSIRISDKIIKVTNGNYFTGKVEYQYFYESELLNVDSLKSIKPFKSFFRYDTMDYQSQFIGKDTLTYYYSGKLNRCLSRINTMIEYECEDYGVFTDSIINFRVYNTDEKVMGQNCKIVEYQTRYYWTKYYVSQDIILAPGTYRRHLAYNWSFYGKIADGGLILKLEHRFKNYTMKGIATHISMFEKSFKANEIDLSSIMKACNYEKP